MKACDYDIITVGGGLAGSALAGAMAEKGFRVLVIEREKKFKDRVRGEQIHPWGVAELKELKLYEPLKQTCGHELPWFDLYLGTEPMFHRNLVETTAQAAPEFSFYHPAMQDIVMQAAINAGAEVKRGAAVRSVKVGAPPEVTALENGDARRYSARLIVGADGRTSGTRKRVGFEVSRKRHERVMAGVLLDDVRIPEDTSRLTINSDLGTLVALFPQGNGRVRAYLMYQRDSMAVLSGIDDLPRFVVEAVRSGAPSEIFERARPAGPLATADTTDTWVDHPYNEGIALVGDAAATNDPSYGEGLSLTVRDVRVLRDMLLNHDDWDVAGRAYAQEHDRYWATMLTCTGWFGAFFYDQSEEALQRRLRALPLVAEDETRVPDHMFSGPELPLNEDVRRRFYGEI